LGNINNGCTQQNQKTELSRCSRVDS
jgi:hypothetical protein